MSEAHAAFSKAAKEHALRMIKIQSEIEDLEEFFNENKIKMKNSLNRYDCLRAEMKYLSGEAWNELGFSFWEQLRKETNESE